MASSGMAQFSPSWEVNLEPLTCRSKLHTGRRFGPANNRLRQNARKDFGRRRRTPTVEPLKATARSDASDFARGQTFSPDSVSISALGGRWLPERCRAIVRRAAGRADAHTRGESAPLSSNRKQFACRRLRRIRPARSRSGVAERLVPGLGVCRQRDKSKSE